MNPNHRLRRSERVLSQAAEGTLVLLDPDSGEYYALDAVGSEVWAMCDGVRSVAEIASAIGTEYAAPHDVIERDVMELLAELSAARLVTLCA